MIGWKKGRGKRRKQLLGDLKGTRRYRNLKEEALNRTLWKTCFGQNRQRVHGEDIYYDKMYFSRRNLTYVYHAFIGTLLATHDINYMSKRT
jgi:hypothetical protein